MFYFVEKYRITISIILGFIALTFVGFGIGSYQWNHDDEAYVAKVGHLVISPNAFIKALKRLEAAGRIQITPQIQHQILEELVGQHLLALEAEKQGIKLSDEQVARLIFSIPQLQENGQFSEANYRYLLQSRQETAKEFEQDVQKQFLIQAQLTPFLSGQIVSHQQIDLLATLLSQNRVVRLAKIEPKNFVSQAKISPAEIKKYYQRHVALFKLPAAVKVAFLIIPARTTSASATPKELQAYYNNHRDLYEKRHIAHILIQTPPDSSPAQRSAAKQKMEALLKTLRTHPARFSQLAKDNSQDPGSAQQGGNIGEITRGMTVKPFETTAFKLKIGQISDVITTQYGYHIIKVNAINVESFEAVKPLIAAQLQDNTTKKIFKKDSRLLTQMVYGQKTLAEIAQTLKHPIQHTDWITGDRIDNPLFAHPQVLAQIFNAELYKHKTLSSPIRLNDGSLLVLQVKARQEARQQNFDEVKPQILHMLIHQHSIQVAYQKGKAALKALQIGHTTPIIWGQPLTVSLSIPNRSLSSRDIRHIFATPLSKFPTYNGFRDNDGIYWIFKIESAHSKPTALSAEEKEQFKRQLEESCSYTQIAAYINKLRSTTRVLYNTAGSH